MAQFNQQPFSVDQRLRQVPMYCKAVSPIRPKLVLALLGFCLASPSFADLAHMKLIPPPGLSSNCNPCHILTPEGDFDELADFSFRHVTLPTENPNVSVTFGNQKFSLDIEPALLENHETFPFFRVEHSNALWFGMYAIPARSGVRDRYYHYFRQDADHFSYLGLLPSLFYDADLHAFAAIRLDEPNGVVEYYGLETSGFDWILEAVSGPVERAAWEATAPYAGPWKIAIEDNNVFLINTEKEVPRFKAEALGSRHSLEVIEEKNYEGFDLIVYFAGGAGTSSITEAKYAAIYSHARNEILGVFPLAYRDETRHTKWKQPEWILGTDKIAVHDVNSNLDVVVKFK